MLYDLVSGRAEMYISANDIAIINILTPSLIAKLQSTITHINTVNLPELIQICKHPKLGQL